MQFVVMMTENTDSLKDGPRGDGACGAAAGAGFQALMFHERIKK